MPTICSGCCRWCKSCDDLARGGGAHTVRVSYLRGEPAKRTLTFGALWETSNEIVHAPRFDDE